MAFEVSNIINGGAAKVYNSPLIGGVIRNPILTALLITALALIVIFATFKYNIKTNGWKPIVKTGFWLGLAVAAILFAHYYALKHSITSEHAQTNIHRVFGAVSNSAEMGGGYQISVDGGMTGGGAHTKNATDGAEEREANLHTLALDELGLEEVTLPSEVDE